MTEPYKMPPEHRTVGLTRVLRNLHLIERHVDSMASGKMRETIAMVQTLIEQDV